MKYLMIVVSLWLMGCGSDSETTQVVPGNVDNTVASITEQDIINEIVNDENSYRQVSGQSPLTLGLSCSVYNLSPVPVPSGSPSWYQPANFPTSLPSAAANFILVGAFSQENSSNSAGIEILPSALKATYTQWVAIRCSGQIVITESNYYAYKLTSDDGSLLYLDGALLINNDGQHAVQSKSASKLMKKGLHSFRLDYFQAGGNTALKLEDQNGIIQGNHFYK